MNRYAGVVDVVCVRCVVVLTHYQIGWCCVDTLSNRLVCDLGV